MNTIQTYIQNLVIDPTLKQELLEKVGGETDPVKAMAIIDTVFANASVALEGEDKKLDEELVAVDQAYQKEIDQATNEVEKKMDAFEAEVADVYATTSKAIDAIRADDVRAELKS